jgi:iron-sulfur cluster insertion protein
MNVTVTDAAKAQMLRVCEKQGYSTIRYWLEGGGCAGLQSRWSCAEPEDGDTHWSLGDGKQFVIDEMTIQYMDGGTINYDTTSFMPTFTVKIPERESCGCGSSFVA